MSPYEVLGVAEDAGEEAVRAAYLKKVKEFPPDEFPDEFEALRDAYDTLRDPRTRIKKQMFSTTFMGPVETLAERGAGGAKRAFAGPAAWLEAIRTK